jgi:hypothetical protein
MKYLYISYEMPIPPVNILQARVSKRVAKTHGTGKEVSTIVPSA